MALQNNKCISVKILANYFVDINKKILNFMWKNKKPRVINIILKMQKIQSIHTYQIQDIIQVCIN